MVTRATDRHEIFPWLMALILILITAENFLANRFYREQRRPAVGSRRRCWEHGLRGS